jgi:purine catabolism regulator
LDFSSINQSPTTIHQLLASRLLALISRLTSHVSNMPDITIQDVLTWEPRLQLVRRPLPGMATADIDEREVSWAVTIRAALPMAQPLRGGELVLLPDRILAESGLTLSVLLRELAQLGAGAAIVETRPAVASPIPVLVAPEVTVEFETELNRTLTEQRGELYRVGTELGRVLTGSAQSRDLTGLITAAGAVLGLSIAVTNSRGAVVAESGEGAVPEGAARTALSTQSPRTWRDHRYLIRLDGDLLWLGPVPPAQRALARLAADRIAQAIEATRRRSVEERPRGAAWSAALAELLRGSPEDAARRGAQLGLSPNARFRVLLVDPDMDPDALARAFQPAGVVHAADEIDTRRVIVLESASARPPGDDFVSRNDSALDRAMRAIDSGVLAGSGPVRGPGQLPEAYRQARYVAALTAGGVIPPGPAVFDRVADTGVYRLLYALWGTPALASYIEDALGPLRAGDRRQILRQTWLAYLDTGGSQTETATALGIHRNTLTYRLRQIAQLTGHDPNDPRRRLAVHVALAAERMPDEASSRGGEQASNWGAKL